MEKMETKKRTFAQTFVDELLTEGARIKCDDTSEAFKNQNELPPFYDEDLFKKGQEFFYKNIFALFFNKSMGLMVVLAVPSILRVLMFTKMSGTCFTAYRRYMATIFHMMVWYKSDLSPGSRFWKSIAEVRNLHNSASKRSCTSGLAGINQKDMALTQFGFMGFALARSKLVGVHHATEEEWTAFLHVWRVVGYLMGIEDRFNICSGTVEQSREICNLLIEQLFRPYVEKKDKDFLAMSSYMLNGLWAMSPLVHYEVIHCYLSDVLLPTNSTVETVQPTCFKLNYVQNLRFYFILYSINLLRYKWFRIVQNYTKIISLWLMRVFPFLAYYQYGIANSHVYILDDNKSK